MNNLLLTHLHFGVRRYANFRKRLPMDFKTHPPVQKNPHALPVKVKEKLLKV